MLIFYYLLFTVVFLIFHIVKKKHIKNTIGNKDQFFSNALSIRNRSIKLLNNEKKILLVEVYIFIAYQKYVTYITNLYLIHIQEINKLLRVNNMYFKDKGVT